MTNCMTDTMTERCLQLFSAMLASGQAKAAAQRFSIPNLETMNYWREFCDQ